MTSATRLEPLPLSEARAIAVLAQRLEQGERDQTPGAHDLLALIKAIGCVQLDSISVVARSHETVIWSRIGAFDPRLVWELYHPRRLVAEYWAHAAAIVPASMLPLFRRRMEQYRDASSPLHAAWRPLPDLNAAILERIRADGPLISRAFERPPGPRPEAWSWWGGKPENKALDFLWTCGLLGIHRREGFIRFYDLMERLHPELETLPASTEEDERRTFVTRALSALGVATPRWVADYFRTGGRPYVPSRIAAKELQALEREGQAIRVAVPGIDEPTWVDASYLPWLKALRGGSLELRRTTLLSPFDNLIWYRERASTLFGFEYRIECYTPAAKRRYGYYVMPILHRGALVGRLDPQFDRRQGRLTIKALYLEPGVPPSAELAEAIAETLDRYCRFLGGRDWCILSTEPREFGHLLPAAHRTTHGHD